MSVDDYIADPSNCLDLTDNIVDYLEDVVGKYHLNDNWAKMRADAPRLKSLTQAWLTRNGLSYNADEFLRCAEWYVNRHKQTCWSWAY